MRGLSLRDVLILHIHAFVVFENDFFFFARTTRIRFVVETGQWLEVYFCRFRLVLSIRVHLATMELCVMGFLFTCIAKHDKGLVQTFLKHTEIMTHLEVHFQAFIILVKTEFLLITTNVANKMFSRHMFRKLLFIVEVFAAELAIRMERNEVSVVIVITVFHMFIKGILSVELLFSQQCCFVLYANIA